MADKILMKGNEAIAEAAIKAGYHTSDRGCSLYGKKNAKNWWMLFASRK